MKCILEQAEDYRRYAQRKCNSHYLLAEGARKKNVLLGFFVILFSSVVGTAIFVSLAKGIQSFPIQVAIGFLSVAAAGFSAFQTFFHFSDIAKQHKDAAASYEAIRHKLDNFLLTYLQAGPKKRAEALQALEAASKEMEEVATGAPTVPDAIYDAVRAKVALNPILEKKNDAPHRQDVVSLSSTRNPRYSNMVPTKDL